MVDDQSYLLSKTHCFICDAYGVYNGAVDLLNLECYIIGYSIHSALRTSPTSKRLKQHNDYRNSYFCVQFDIGLAKTNGN